MGARGQPNHVMRIGPIPFANALAAVLVSAAPLGAQRHIVQTYTVSDGLPSNHMQCLVSDRDGFLWICTRNGLARFDGSRFVTYGTEDGLPDPSVNNFLHARSGVRWAATNGGGIARLEAEMPDPEGRVFTAFPVGGSPRSMRVNVLFETRDGTLLAGTDGGLFRAREADLEPRFEPIPLDLPGFPDDGLQIWSIAEDGAGRTWVGTSRGLVLLGEPERPVHIPVAPIQDADHVWAIAPDPAGRLWLGHETGLVVWVRPAEHADVRGSVAGLLTEGATPCVTPTSASGSRPRLPDGAGAACRWRPGGGPQRRSQVRGLLRTPDGRLWMATAAGLFAFDGERLHRFPATLNGGYSQVAMDRGGDLWIGSVRGAHRVQRRGFTRFTTDDGLVGGLRTFFRGPDGHFYGVSARSIIHRLDGERWTAVRPQLPAQAGVAGRSVYGAALLDRSGAWWVGTGAGLLRFPAVERLEDLAHADPLARYTTADGLAGDDIWRLFEDARGDVWIATRVPGPEPLTRWERSSGRFHRYGAAQGLPPARAVNAFAEDRSGALWVSIWGGGLARFDGRDFRFFAPGTAVPVGPRSQILVDRRGWLWVGGRQVVYSTDPEAADPRFRTYRTAEGHPVQGGALGEDRSGWIYAGSPSGLVRFHPRDGHLQRLGFSDINGPLHRDDDGTLWVRYQRGVLRYEPRYERDGDPPLVRIGGVSVADVPLPVPAMGATRLAPVRPAAGRQIRIEYFGLGFGAHEPLRFQVRLEGTDDEWSGPISERTVLYAGLGPGRYRFQVRAVGATGAATPEPATVAFTVPPPVWRRGWFLAAVILALASLLVGAHRLRVRRLLELERVRTRIAADLHDDLGASLARVSLLAEAIRRKLRESPDAAERMLREIGETSRSLVSAAGDIAFSIDPGRGGLEALAARVRRFAEELLAGTDLEWRFKIEGETESVVLSSDQRRHLLAILKEALHNAVRHGRPGRLTLTLAVRGDVLEVDLVDDGRGFAPDHPGGGGTAGGGHGLRNLRRRAGELSAALEIDSRPGAGTRLSLVVPL